MFTNQGEYRAMQAEMQTIKALKIHPNIVHFLEVGEIEVKIKKILCDMLHLWVGSDILLKLVN